MVYLKPGQNDGDDDEKDGYNWSLKDRWQKRRYKIKLAKKEDLGALLDALIHSFGRFFMHTRNSMTLVVDF